MRRRLSYLYRVFAIVLSLFLTMATAFSIESKGKREKQKQQKVGIAVTPSGPLSEETNRVAGTILGHSKVQSYLRGNRFRQLAFQKNDPDNKDGKSSQGSTFEVIYYDYTNNRVINARGKLKDLSTIEVTESFYQPHGTYEEFEEAVRVLMSDEYFGPKLREKALSAYAPMPPVLYPTKENERVERTINVGLFSGDGKTVNEVVGVNMVTGKIVRYKDGAPSTCLAAPQACGISASGGVAGDSSSPPYQVTITQGQTTLWDFQVLRPSASSGNPSERSGIEIRNVKYRGKMVLKRGHAPILNVEYEGNACGPYRDWQTNEGFFQTPAGSTDVSPGIRLSPSPPSTALDGSDAGNFGGVVIYTQGSETVLVSEMNAGWYRYLMEWRLDNDGTIRPRYGFGATVSSCVCSPHNHHVYWRFDFDIVNANNKVYRTEIPKKLADRAGWRPINNEAMMLRSYPTKRSFIVQNANGPEAYSFSLNTTDGTSDAYGKGDVWILQYKQDGSGNPLEINDPNTNTTANIHAWLNNESTSSQDIVIWYGAHFRHIDGNNIALPAYNRGLNILTGSHVIGPDLRPMNW